MRRVYIQQAGNGYRLIDIRYGWILVEIQDDEIDQIQALEDLCKKANYKLVKSPRDIGNEK